MPLTSSALKSARNILVKLLATDEIRPVRDKRVDVMVLVTPPMETLADRMQEGLISVAFGMGTVITRAPLLDTTVGRPIRTPLQFNVTLTTGKSVRTPTPAVTLVRVAGGTTIRVGSKFETPGILGILGSWQLATEVVATRKKAMRSSELRNAMVREDNYGLLERVILASLVCVFKYLLQGLLFIGIKKSLAFIIWLV